MFRRILVAVSDGAAAGLLDYARMVVELSAGAEVLFVHVTETAASTHSASEALERQLCAAPGWPETARCEIVRGDRTDALVEAAIRSDADLILVGHHQRRSRRRTLARRLAMTAPCSIWMVPEGSPSFIRSVLAPIDFSDRSADALSLATEISAAAALEQCTALYVDFNPVSVIDAEMEERRIVERDQRFSIFAARINLHDVAVQPAFVECPHVGRAILQAAEDSDAGVIVMSTRGRSRSASVLLGSETEHVLMQADRPVLAVKHFGSRMHFLEALLDKRTRDRNDLYFG